MELFAGGVTMIQIDNFFGSFIEVQGVWEQRVIGRETDFSEAGASP